MLAAWLVEQEAEGLVTESTVQYWKPMWELDRYSPRRLGLPPKALENAPSLQETSLHP